MDDYIVPAVNIDPMNGFRMDLSSVSAEMAAGERVCFQYRTPLEAGIEKVIACAQKHLEEPAEYRASLESFSTNFYAGGV